MDIFHSELPWYIKIENINEINRGSNNLFIDFPFSQGFSSEFLLMKYANVFKIKFDFPEKSIAVRTSEI